MTIEEAIEYLKRADTTVGNKIKTRTAEAIEMAIKALEQTEWIPVSERLPEKSTWVLVTCKNPDGYIYVDIKLINQHTGLWDGDEDFIGTVLAWMPLPKPYEPQGDEK